jgi:hypothetical protein
MAAAAKINLTDNITLRAWPTGNYLFTSLKLPFDATAGHYFAYMRSLRVSAGAFCLCIFNHLRTRLRTGMDLRTSRQITKPKLKNKFQLLLHKFSNAWSESKFED